MSTWTVRFRGANERETLANADYFFLSHNENLGMSREEFFSQLVLSEDGTLAVFVEGGGQAARAGGDEEFLGGA